MQSKVRTRTRMNIHETARWLQARDNFLVITHRRPDGDAIGSGAALCQGLRELGKTAYLYRNEGTTDRYVPYSAPYWAPEGFSPEHAVTVDTASEDMLPEDADTYAGRISLAIDHHPSNTGYARALCLDASRASCGEVVYEILLALCGRIGPESATLLYIAASTDTGCFSFGNTTSNTLRVAAELVDAGAPLGPLNKYFFRQKTRSRILLEGMITSALEFSHGGAVCIATITNAMMARANATSNDLDDIAAIPGSVEGVLVGITVRELDHPGHCKVSVRSMPTVDANALCGRFGGGGHKMAAGFALEQSVEEIKRLLMPALDDLFPPEETPEP